MNITSDSDLIMMYFEKLPDTLKLLGDVLCKYIPDEKTLSYSGNDIDRWTSELFGLLKKSGKV